MSLHPDTLYRIALKGTQGIGAITARNLVSYCGSCRAVFQTRKSRLLKIPGVGETLACRILQSDGLLKAERELKYVEENRISVHFYLDDTYPERLSHIQHAPMLLYSRGAVDLNALRSVAIVGTRKPTLYGRQMVDSIIGDLVAYEPMIVSGLAYGIDIEAHRSSLKHGLPTVGVMANGLGMVYPRQHLGTAKKMMEQGGLLSEFDHDVGPEKDQFPARNRIIAGLADAVIVIESGESGGSMITASFANDFNRDVGAVPGRSTDKYSQGCNHLIASHQAVLVTSGKAVAEMMSWDVDLPKDGRQKQIFIDLSEAERLVLETIGQSEPAEFELIRYTTKSSPSELASVLLSLEFKGVIKALPGKRFQRI